MKILLGLILLHLTALFSARKFEEIDLIAVLFIFFLSLLMTGWILFGMYTMEKPDTTEQFF